MSALNKQMVRAQYAQCEQIGNLEKSLSNELKAINAVNRQLLANQIEEAQRQERINYYRNLAHNMKECISIIDKQTDLIFKSFLLAIFQQPIGLYMQDAKANLEEIGDKEFCSKWENVLQENDIQVRSVRSEYVLSPFNILLEQHDAFKKEEDLITGLIKLHEKDKQKIKPPTLVQAKSMNSYQKRGCVITMLIICILSFFLFLGGVSADAPIGTSTILFVVIPLAILWYRIKYSRKRKGSYSSYLAQLESENNIRLQNYKDAENDWERNASDLETQQAELYSSHPYIKAKAEIDVRIPKWDSIIDTITSKLPDSAASKQNSYSDPNIPKIAKYVVKNGFMTSTMLQRKFQIGSNQAVRIMNELEDLGIVSKPKPSGLRDVLVDAQSLEGILKNY